MILGGVASVRKTDGDHTLSGADHLPPGPSLGPSREAGPPPLPRPWCLVLPCKQSTESRSAASHMAAMGPGFPGVSDGVSSWSFILLAKHPLLGSGSCAEP